MLVKFQCHEISIFLKIKMLRKMFLNYFELNDNAKITMLRFTSMPKNPMLEQIKAMLE